MYCRVAITRLNTSELSQAALDKGTQIWRQEGVPLLKSQKGFHSLQIMGSLETGKVMVITTWDSKESSDASASQPQRNEFNRRVATAMGITLPPPTVEEYEMAIHEHV